MAWPNESLITLSRSQSRNSAASSPPPRSACANASASSTAKRARLGSPVSASWCASRRSRSSSRLRAVMSRATHTTVWSDVGDTVASNQTVRRPKRSAYSTPSIGRPVSMA
ncbi:MAG: hypothetical protein AVDCRST_MAG40-1405 [uncultured Gemmatimonadaceae bacterium]|uniref:Uncharacterized protein n=1 Tax=uncultured Gemmatimonadaceae bacterium TaxID=246130 RepID=A0A6J4KZG9_9BACT|nr:MAG: hypothetical protein AVDCRST_MAG40-1405 [uncultured Gemmatimonadaceae bacterium]